MDFGLFDALMRSNMLGLYIYQEDGRIVFANKAFIDFIEYPEHELLGKNLLDLIEDVPQKEVAKRNIKRRLRGEIFGYEYEEIRYITKKGYPKYSLNFAYTISYRGKPSGLVLVLDTHKQKVYEKLYKSLSEINQLIVRTREVNELLESTCRILVDNIGFKLVVIGKVTQERGFKISHIYGEKSYVDYFKRVENLVEKALQSGTGTIGRAYRSLDITVSENVYEDSFMQPWIEHFKRAGVYSVCSIPLFKQKRFEYVLVIYSSVPYQFSRDYMSILKELQLDLSFALDRMEAERDLINLNFAFNQSFSWILFTDADGVIVKVNKAVERISGYSSDELIGKRPSIFKSGFHSREFYKQLWDRINSGKTGRYLFVNRAKDGRIFYLDSVVVPVFIHHRLHRIISIGRDVTREREQNERIRKLTRLYKTLSEINRAMLDYTDKERLVGEITRIMHENLGCSLTFFMRFEEDSFYLGKIFTTDKAFENYIELLNRLPLDELKKTPFYRALHKNLVYVENDMPSSQRFAALRDDIKRLGLKACFSMPVVESGCSCGVICGFFTENNVFDKAIYNLLKEIKEHISFALEKIEINRWNRILNEVINHGFDYVVITDSQFRIVYVNENTVKVSGYSREELIGKGHEIFSSGNNPREFVEEFYNKLLSGETFTGVMTYKTKEGRYIQAFMNIIPFKSGDRIEYYIGIGRDITQEKHLQGTIERILTHDVVTGLINRHAFVQRVQHFIERARYTHSIGAVLVINPINFKEINRAYGFDFGNVVLKLMGERMESSLREYDVVARLESDRFGLLIKDLKHRDDVTIVAQKLFEELSKPYRVGESNPISISFNAGASLYPYDGSRAEELIKRAEIALADAKKKGEHAISYFRKDFEREAKERVKLIGELKEALLKEEFVLFYQPYFTPDGEPVGAEALIRWQDNGVIRSPDTFVPLLEETGLIVRVEEWVRANVMKMLKKRRSEGKRLFPISVNVSPKSFKSDRFAEQVIYTAENTGIDPGLITVEIVERTFLDDVERAAAVMKRLKERGFRFSVDDFGTGYSSLSYLSHLPIDFIKIDRAFINNMIKQESARAIVESVVYMAKRLGMKTIAEGVETREQLEMLDRLGCDYIQGYLFAKPMPESQLYTFLDERWKNRQQ